MKWLRDMESLPVYLVIAGALLAGLAASYGRELEAGRRPDRRWWLRRLLIMPLLAIAATTATHAFDLATSIAAFCAAMLSLSGYDALNLIELKWRQKVAGVGDGRPVLTDQEEAPPTRK